MNTSGNSIAPFHLSLDEWENEGGHVNEIDYSAAYNRWNRYFGIEEPLEYNELTLDTRAMFEALVREGIA